MTLFRSGTTACTVRAAVKVTLEELPEIVTFCVLLTTWVATANVTFAAPAGTET